MRSDAAGKNRVPVVQQMLRRDRRGDAAPGGGDEFNRARRRNVLEHHAQAGEAFEQRLQHRIDEMRFTIEYIHFGVRRFAVHQQRHADLFHAPEHPVHPRDIAHAGIGVRGRAGGIQFDAVDEPASLRAIDLLRRRSIRQVQGEQRFEARVGRQRRQDSVAVRARRRRGGDRRLQIGHHDGSPESLRGKFHDRGERGAVAQMYMPIIGASQRQGIHLGAAAATCAAAGEGAGGQPRRSRSRV